MVCFVVFTIGRNCRWNIPRPTSLNLNFNQTFRAIEIPWPSVPTASSYVCLSLHVLSASYSSCYNCKLHSHVLLGCGCHRQTNTNIPFQIIHIKLLQSKIHFYSRGIGWKFIWLVVSNITKFKSGDTENNTYLFF